MTHPAADLGMFSRKGPQHKRGPHTCKLLQYPEN